MYALNEVVAQGEHDAKMGQGCILGFSIVLILDVVLGAFGVVTMWIVWPLTIAYIVFSFGTFYYLFGTLSNIFAVSRASNVVNSHHLNRQAQ